MLDRYNSLLPEFSPDKPLHAIAVGTQSASLAELSQLLNTLGVRVDDAIQANLRRVNPATFFGKGKVEEVKNTVKKENSKVVVFDEDLSPNQLRNLEKALACPTIDRAGIILEIFSQHARTKEAKTQVELARLQYLLPRLRHYWTHFERQRGGIGLKGMGEKQIEVDRRLLGKRVDKLKKSLKQIEKERAVQRSGRKEVLKVALVGYTNAGKSTLLNALTQSEVLAENKLFATLDSSVRALDPDSKPPIVAIDTVGFIQRIPPNLVASFRSTLEELNEADLLVQVVDASSSNAKEELEVTEQILEDLGVIEKPRMVVLNKIDLLKPGQKNLVRLISPGSLRISAYQKEEVLQLREKIMNFFIQHLELWEVLIPYGDRVSSKIHEIAKILRQRHLEKGTFYRVRIDATWAKKLSLEKYRI